MPSIRIGYSSEFVLRNELVGIGSTATSERLDVAGQIRSENTAGSGGVSTFREYQGFSQTEAELSNEVLIDNGSGGPFSSLTGEIKITGETTVSSGSTVEVGKTKTLTVTDRFSVPLGETNNRDNAPEAGTTRFNQDFGTLEFFDGANWKTVNSYARYGAAGRGFFGGGNSPSKESVIDQVNISSLGNATSFGDMSTGMNQAAGTASETRGLLSGGYSQDSVRSDNIDYFTMASSGTAIDFGNLTEGRSHPGGCSSSTRSVIATGYPAPNYTDVIDYVEIATLGDAIQFGDVTLQRDELTGLSSPTRGIFAGGDPANAIIEFITIAAKGNAIDFGDLTSPSEYTTGGGNGTRGIIVTGATPLISDKIDQITIATTGNAVDFGGICSLSLAFRGGSACTKTRMVFGGGSTTAPGTTVTNHIESITINSNGNGIDFGDLTIARVSPGGLSDSHGGLGGF
jgi:hypothetical protein